MRRPASRYRSQTERPCPRQRTTLAGGGRWPDAATHPARGPRNSVRRCIAPRRTGSPTCDAPPPAPYGNPTTPSSRTPTSPPPHHRPSSMSPYNKVTCLADNGHTPVFRCLIYALTTGRRATLPLHGRTAIRPVPLQPTAPYSSPPCSPTSDDRSSMPACMPSWVRRATDPQYVPTTSLASGEPIRPRSTPGREEHMATPATVIRLAGRRAAPRVDASPPVHRPTPLPLYGYRPRTPPSYR